MAKVIAGEVVSFRIGDFTIQAKVEDASKSDFILAKVEKSSSPDYKDGQVYEFDRNDLKDS
ncbi:hypothetical protein [Pedobacter ureilyticus]|uniref:Uncharacterized protein n=1 Tax=Pedobacter ureilyticus TaxID=1393051 RepID=A0ABW9J8E2_9SPHI|nr:hypothetical protein [Pedobacter helvus]